MPAEIQSVYVCGGGGVCVLCVCVPAAVCIYMLPDHILLVDETHFTFCCLVYATQLRTMPLSMERVAL